MLKGNKGEWSEVYTFLKILLERKIFGADKDLNKIKDLVFPVRKIFRQDAGTVKEYVLISESEVSLNRGVLGLSVINIRNLKFSVQNLLNEIRDNDGSFHVSNMDDVMEKLGIENLNAGNNRKEDLVLEVYDKEIGHAHKMGFSIKSRLGADATLLNASKTTNFTYEVKGISFGQTQKINQIVTRSKIKDRISKIYANGGSLVFSGLASETFEKNLRKSDTLLPEILSELMLAYYLGKGRTVPELVASVSEASINIRGFIFSKEDLEFKLKSFLISSALGMVPGTLWNGSLNVHGGVLVLRDDGEVVCFHLYNVEHLRDFLYNSVRLETAGSSKHSFGKIYGKDGKFFINLNLQVRFI